MTHATQHQALVSTTEESGSAEFFTGDVALARFFTNTDPEIDMIAVRFAASARTNWHTHREGQILWVVDGEAVVVDEGGNPQRIRKGEAAYTPPGINHWHGSAGEEMTHLSLATDGPPDWGDRVDDEAYQDGIRHAAASE